MMRRPLSSALITVVGLVLLADLLVVNRSLATIGTALADVIVLLAAVAALAGAIALLSHRWSDLVAHRRERAGSLAVLAGMAIMLLAGFYPGSRGADDVATRWLVGSLLAPLAASLLALLFIFVLAAAHRGLALRSSETTVMLLGALTVLILLLPVGGAAGAWLSQAANWALAVPIGAVFRGLLIGVAIMTALTAARLILGLHGRDE